VARVFTREQFYELVWTKPMTCLEPCASVLASYPTISASLERRVAHRLHTRDLFAGSPFANRSGLRAGSVASRRLSADCRKHDASRGQRLHRMDQDEYLVLLRECLGDAFVAHAIAVDQGQ